jgi:hypothetical protein
LEFAHGFVNGHVDLGESRATRKEGGQESKASRQPRKKERRNEEGRKKSRSRRQARRQEGRKEE